MRIKGGVTSRRRHKSVLSRSKGFRGRRKNCFRLAKLAVQRAEKYAFRDRRVNKRAFRSLWIMRINAAARLNGITYSSLIRGLNLANVEVDRKILADLAANDSVAFAAFAEKAKLALAA